MPRIAANTPVAFVLDLDVNGLAVVRSLGRESIPVVGLYSKAGDIGRFSKYCTAVRLPEGIVDSELTDFVLKLADRFDEKPVLFPTTDAYAQWVSDEQVRLQDRFLFHANERDLFTKLNSKLGIISLQDEHNMPAPWTRHYLSMRDFEAEVSDIPTPVIVKPVDTFSRCLPDKAKNVLFSDSDPLVDYVAAHPDHLQNMVFQQVVTSGDGHILISTVLLDRESQPVMWYTGRKLRQHLPDYGVTTFGVSEVNEGLAQTSIDFMRALGYRGICTLEFSEDRKTGEHFFLEVNLRSYYHNQLFYDCGLNFPHAEYALLTGRPLAQRVMRLQREGLHWLDFNRDFGSFYHKMRNGELGLRAWLRSLAKARSFAAFATDDLKPWLRRSFSLVAILAGFLLQKIRRRSGDTSTLTPPQPPRGVRGRGTSR
ncbi:MAG: hypothetical protein OER90_03565 [Gemmatimonadota bacterium]|nr:hypothetical protein [Gemmatimonadota bacterium]